ncbi:MAG: hypothetical protein RLZZ241_2105 [Bacteroidota bacterium]|jgi:hypothetical protein
MTKKRLFLIGIVLVFITVNAYLFLTAPEPLTLENNQEKYVYSVNDGFEILAKLNDNYRRIYTKRIVGDGSKANLKFDENWQNHTVEAGPLPALFLRATSANLEKSPLPLGLYLGSDYPIAESNLLTGVQGQKFEEIKQDKQPRFFYDEDTQRYIAMFPDFAAADACVTCHNEHKASPKTDWKLNDIMGATTWSYPRDSLTAGELLEWVAVYNESAQKSYATYLEKTKGFITAQQPEIGQKWPVEGTFLPDVKTFSDEVLKDASFGLVQGIVKLDGTK